MNKAGYTEREEQLRGSVFYWYATKAGYWTYDGYSPPYGWYCELCDSAVYRRSEEEGITRKDFFTVNSHYHKVHPEMFAMAVLKEFIV